MAKEVSEEAADKLKAANNKHVDLEPVSVIINRVLNGVVEAVVADLGQTKDYQRNQVLGLQECILDLYSLFFAFLDIDK